MDENGVSSQIVLILLSLTTPLIGSECQIYLGGEHAQRPNFIRHFARFNFSRLSLAFISKYYPILHVA